MVYANYNATGEYNENFNGGKETDCFKSYEKNGFQIQRICSILSILAEFKSEIENAGFKYKSFTKNERYVWIEDSNNTIGRRPAHYEFIARRNTLYLELVLNKQSQR